MIVRISFLVGKATSLANVKYATYLYEEAEAEDTLLRDQLCCDLVGRISIGHLLAFRDRMPKEMMFGLLLATTGKLEETARGAETLKPSARQIYDPP